MNDRFTSPTPFTREQLEAYALGGLSPEQQHAVELLLEESPLHREAVEGYRAVPEAALVDLDRHRPGRAGGTSWIIGGGAVVIVAVLLWRGFMASPEPIEPGPVAQEQHTPAPTTTSAISISTEELAAAQELPESLQIGHEPIAARPPVLVLVPRDEPVVLPDPIAPRGIQPRATDADTRGQKPKVASRPSRHCVFLHDLKVVHPDELYPERSPMFYQTGVPANQGTSVNEHIPHPTTAPTRQKIDTAAWNKLLRDSAPKVSYLDYMDHALGAFARGEHATALEELRYLLTQFPNDVNALFYCGLSAYNMGLTSKASAWFQRARDHEVDTFGEEADWYRALCIEQLYGKAAAAKEYARISAQGGFYAPKAKERITPAD